MHDDESIKKNVSPTSSADLPAALDLRIVRALEHMPKVRIPADFAARVAGQIPARPIVTFRSTHYGRGAMVISMVVLLAALLGLAGHRTNLSPLGLALQWTFFAQFIGLVVWLSMRRYKTL